MHKCIKLLKKIPRGKVVSYSELAKACGTSPRAVGRILHSNKYPDEYPCYKVVRKDGSISGYSLGIKEKIKRLKAEGIKIKNGKIPKKFFFHFS